MTQQPTKQQRMAFPMMVKQLRKAQRFRQREVAEAIGVGESTVGNLEYNNFKTISIERVHKLAQFLSLDPSATQQLVNAWNALPASAYNDANRPRWEKAKSQREKAKACDLFQISLLEVLARWLGDQPEGACSCPDPDPFTDQAAQLCELCTALALFKLKWTTFDEVIGHLDDIRAKVSP